MHRTCIYIALIIFTIALMANSFHRHVDLAGLAKCPVCSGKYVSASTHVSVETPLVIESETRTAATFPCSYPQILNPVSSSFRDRAPPSPA